MSALNSALKVLSQVECQLLGKSQRSGKVRANGRFCPDRVSLFAPFLGGTLQIMFTHETPSRF